MKAEYIDHMGTDLTVVNAARVSFDKQSDWECEQKPIASGGLIAINRLSDRDVKLIQYLAKHGHWTPFGHPQITLRETVPIFVARQRFKHTVGFVYNEVSRRYVDDAPEFYEPDVWRSRADDKKQGSGRPLSDDGQIWATSRLRYAHKITLGTYNALLEDGVAPEQARMVLPQSMYTSYYVTGSLAAWARAYNLRIDAHAQKEIQMLAEQWGLIIGPLFPVSWEALG